MYILLHVRLRGFLQTESQNGVKEITLLALQKQNNRLHLPIVSTAETELQFIPKIFQMLHSRNTLKHTCLIDKMRNWN